MRTLAIFPFLVAITSALVIPQDWVLDRRDLLDPSVETYRVHVARTDNTLAPITDKPHTGPLPSFASLDFPPSGLPPSTPQQSTSSSTPDAINAIGLSERDLKTILWQRDGIGGTRLENRDGTWTFPFIYWPNGIGDHDSTYFDPIRYVRKGMPRFMIGLVCINTGKTDGCRTKYHCHRGNIGEGPKKATAMYAPVMSHDACEEFCNCQRLPKSRILFG